MSDSYILYIIGYSNEQINWFWRMYKIYEMGHHLDSDARSMLNNFHNYKRQNDRK